MGARLQRPCRPVCERRIGGIEGAILFFGIALAMNVGSYWASAEIVLRTSKAREISREDDPALFDLIANVAESSGMPMPRVYIMDSPQPNAFATGRSPKHAAVAVTTGIRQLLTERELRGVLGNEMAHVKNRDILTSSIVATIASAISLIGFAAFFFGGSRRSGGGLAMWLSHRDTAQIHVKAVDAPDSLMYTVVFAMSDNYWNIFSLDKARKVLGYKPQDDAGQHINPDSKMSERDDTECAHDTEDPDSY